MWRCRKICPGSLALSASSLLCCAAVGHSSTEPHGMRPGSTARSWLPRRRYHLRLCLDRMTSLVLRAHQHLQRRSASIRLRRRSTFRCGDPEQATRTAASSKFLPFLPRNAGLTGAIQAVPTLGGPGSAHDAPSTFAGFLRPAARAAADATSPIIGWTGELQALASDPSASLGQRSSGCLPCILHDVRVC
jgi:hypothetical protein